MENRMATNINAAPKTHQFTLIYTDNETKEIFSHKFLSDKEDIYGDELTDLLMLPAEESWHELYTGEADMEMIKNIADTYTALALVYGHPQIEEGYARGKEYNPMLNVFGKPSLRVVN